MRASSFRHLLPSAVSAALFTLILAVAPPQAFAADEAAPLVTDPQLEERVMDLSHKLRCLVCQNQSIAESNAPLALDLRNQVREQLAAGKSEEAVVDYLVARYGDFVLYLPPFKGTTLLLWLGPALLLVAGAGWLGWRLRRRAEEVRSAPHLTRDERARARALLDGTSPGTSPSSEEPRS
ncbi:cytochrome c-type biogenesis protein [Aromatoleum anaerobium]|uniref:Cytochrome c-type biogenesis protein n=1 Tax=Aromatoleum anaerobium TaxID=182180 RepID=A0ABX1PM06_9RHOO|nr:cytochrome c-type biogenesis protein [Aromatoleum anaerobium]MCK0505955.1 cytochrome c-type biogenesis protein CcmH [Aromatoleum anaerobium]